MAKNDKLILIDFENIQNINLDEIPGENYSVYVFIGESQNKIPIELVLAAQNFGNRLDWVKIEGNGPNALDFHIAYFLGKEAKENPGREYIVLSKDKGFDPLMRYIRKQGVKCTRINSLMEIPGTKKTPDKGEDYQKVVENLKKIEKTKRPRKRTTLMQHIRTVLGKNITPRDVNHIIDELFMSGFTSEENGKLRYDK